MEVKYYVCNHCENIIEMVKDKGVPVICCGEPMQELKAGVTDAAVEKHVPVYTVEGSHVHIQGFEDQLDIMKKAIREEDSKTLKAMFIESSKRRRNLEK